MDKSIYLKNFKLLKQKCGFIFEDLNENKDDIEEVPYDVCIYQATNGNSEIYLDFFERGIVQLGSQYDSELYAKKWFEKVNEGYEITEGSILICFGLGSVEYLKEIRRHMKKDTVLLIYEPSMKILKSVLHNIDLTEIDGENVVIVDSEKRGTFAFLSFLRMTVTARNLSLIKFYDLPNYNRVFRKEYDKYFEQTKNVFFSMQVNLNTAIHFSKVAYDNVLSSMCTALDSYSLNDLFNHIPSGKTGVIISAGPSLQKNITELKRAKGKAFLMATDTALKPLLKNGIIPDMYVTLDAVKYLELFDDERVKNIPVLASFEAKKEVIESNMGRVFFEYSNGIFNRLLAKIDGKTKNVRLAIGGSVATLAFTFLIQARMKQIIFVGQDLAYTGNKKHIEGAFNDKQDLSKEEKETGPFVEDINGEMVPTGDDMIQYKKWFEESITHFENIRFIDATEGGAKIEGTEIMTLKEAIDTFCEEEIDYSECIKKAKPLFEGDLKEAYYEEIFNIETELDELEKVCSDLHENYAVLNEISEKENITKEELIVPLAAIRKGTNYMDKESILDPMLEFYTSWEGIKSEIYVNKSYDDIHEDLQDISRRGTEKVETYQKAIEELGPRIKEMIENVRVKYEKDKNI